jgi:hypothetical protein
MHPRITQLAGRIRDYLLRPTHDSLQQISGRPDAATQILLQLDYRRLAKEGRGLPALRDVGFRVRSQTDEDGILLYLFSIIGAHHKTCVEICAGDGLECNTANLILNHGWHGLLVDGNAANVARGTDFYRLSKETYVHPPSFACAWVTRGNVNELLTSHGFAGEIDLLSLDLDGVDYWIWEAIEAVCPRVIVLEYQDILGPDRSWTVRYADDFAASRHSMTGANPNFAGASLAAFAKLGQRKGYRLVGVNRYGFNAFFVREGLADDLIPAVPVGQCFTHPKVIIGMRDRFPLVQGEPWVEV